MSYTKSNITLRCQLNFPVFQISRATERKNRPSSMGAARDSLPQREGQKSIRLERRQNARTPGSFYNDSSFDRTALFCSNRRVGASVHPLRNRKRAQTRMDDISCLARAHDTRAGYSSSWKKKKMERNKKGEFHLHKILASEYIAFSNIDDNAKMDYRLFPLRDDADAPWKIRVNKAPCAAMPRDNRCVDTSARSKTRSSPSTFPPPRGQQINVFIYNKNTRVRRDAKVERIKRPFKAACIFTPGNGVFLPSRDFASPRVSFVHSQTSR